MSNNKLQHQAMFDSLSPSERLGYDRLRKCLWVICPNLEGDAAQDGVDFMDLWENCEQSRSYALMLMDSIKQAGLTISQTDLVHSSPYLMDDDDWARIMAEKQRDESAHGPS